MPKVWIFQIFFPLISPVMDLILLYTLVSNTVDRWQQPTGSDFPLRIRIAPDECPYAHRRSRVRSRSAAPHGIQGAHRSQTKLRWEELREGLDYRCATRSFEQRKD